MFSEYLKQGVRRQCSVMPGVLRECAVHNVYRIEAINRVGEGMFTPLLSSLIGKCKAFQTISNRLENFIRNFQPPYSGIAPICSGET